MNVVDVQVQPQSLINRNGRERLMLCAAWAPALIQQLHTCFTKTAARYPARRKKNLWRQRPVIFAQSDSWTARSRSSWAPQASRQSPMFSLLLMQNRWDFFWQFLGFLSQPETFCPQKLHIQSRYPNSYLTLEHKWKKLSVCMLMCLLSTCSWGGKQPAWGRTLLADWNIYVLSFWLDAA